jgi:hypothetical protein
VTQIGLEADRRREEQLEQGEAALARIRAKGETLGMIAALANISEREVRAYLKAAGTRAGAPAGAARVPDPLAPVLVAEGGEDVVSARRSVTRRMERQTCGGDDTLGG